MSTLTDKLVKDLDSMESRVNANPDNIPRDVLVFLPKAMIGTEPANEALELAKEIKKANLGSKVVVERNTDFMFNPVEGINITFSVDKNTNIPKLRELLITFGNK